MSSSLIPLSLLFPPFSFLYVFDNCKPRTPLVPPPRSFHRLFSDDAILKKINRGCTNSDAIRAIRLVQWCMCVWGGVCYSWTSSFPVIKGVILKNGGEEAELRSGEGNGLEFPIPHLHAFTACTWLVYQSWRMDASKWTSTWCPTSRDQMWKKMKQCFKRCSTTLTCKSTNGKFILVKSFLGQVHGHHSALKGKRGGGGLYFEPKKSKVPILALPYPMVAFPLPPSCATPFLVAPREVATTSIYLFKLFSSL
jgi:hypothetical protein